ncbi:hypothetical protein ACIGEZ_03800 [Streptomyces sp. NPDC085481]|uniref:hypothetical protein n=1 Tax=Streptomyces sp. NPDC085481 TaxID=3365727 RepID=UPI0037CFF2CE
MRTRIRHGLAAALAVSALSLTAACGGGAKDTPGDGATKPADKPAAGQTTSAAPAPAAPLTDAQMKAAVLELKDLPSGWKASKNPSSDFSMKADKAECEPLAAAAGSTVAGATKGPTVDFALGNNASELSEGVLAFSGTGAADFMKQVATSLGSCTAFTADTSGTKMKITVEKLTAPQTAEEALAFKLKLNVAQGITVEPTLLIARQGTGVVRLLHLADTPAAKKDFATFAGLAGDKLAKAAQG